MAEALLPFLRRDLAEALRAGLDSDPASSCHGAIWLLSLALALGGLGGALCLLGGYHTGFSSLNSWSTAYPGWWWQCWTMLGDEYLAFTLTLFFSRRHPRVFWALVCAALVGAAYSRGLKPLIDAARPPAVMEAGVFELIGPAHRRESFPSGHSVTAAVFFGVLIYYARWTEWRLWFALVALTAGLSRVAVGVHWPIDVAAGLAGGFLAALLGAELARRSQGGATNPAIHLPVVALACLMALVLLIAGRGYPEALWPARLIASAALLFTLWVYLISPVRRYLTSRA